MSKEKTNRIVPNLRFGEFRKIGDWEEKTLNEYLKLLTDFEANGSFADVKKNVIVYDEPNFAWYVRATDLENSTDLQNVKYVDENSYTFLRKTSLFGGELLISKRGEIGKVFFFVQKNNLPATVAPNLYLLKMNEKAVPQFFYYFFTSSSGYKALTRLSASSTIGALYKDDVKGIKLYSPTHKEQQKIAECLSSLDDLITAESQKLDALKDHKKGLMQQLFPAEGEKVPKRRFEEFRGSGEWEEKSIQQLIDDHYITSHLDGNHGELYPRAEEFSKDGIPYISANDFISGSVSFQRCKYLPLEKANKFKKGVAKNGDILFAHNATVGPVAKLNTSYDFVVLSTTATYFRCDDMKLHNDFLKFALCSPALVQQYSSVMSQSTRNQVPITTQRKFNLQLPKIKEQQKIASCLSSLDDLVAAQAERIEVLNLHKKGLMQGLFPNVNLISNG
jgi:type I restriction enzyme, S subunit